MEGNKKPRRQRNPNIRMCMEDGINLNGENAAMHPGRKNYWDWKNNAGRKKIIKDGEHLLRLAKGYFEWCETNPVLRPEMIKGGDSAGMIKHVPIVRPYNWSGLTAYAFRETGIMRLDNIRYNFEGRYGDFIDAVRIIDEIMREQTQTGASAGIYNANIISRMLGLAEQVEQKVTQTMKQDFDYSKLSNEALEEIAKLVKETNDVKQKRD